jgi:hypothetical protein
LQGFDIDRDEELEEIMVDVAQGVIGRDELADLFFDAVNASSNNE